MGIFVLLPFILIGSIVVISLFAAVTGCYRIPLSGDIVTDDDGKCYVVLGSSVSGDEVVLQEVDPDTFDTIYDAQPVRKKSFDVAVIHVNWNNPFRRS